MSYFDKYSKYKTKYLNKKQKGNGNIKEIYLIRHGQTEWNKLGKGQGQEADIPLNDTGIEEATKTANYLKKYRINDKQFDCIYASPMKRANKTAEIIKSIIGFKDDIIYDDELKERKHGKLSGITKEDPLHSKFKKLVKESTPIDPIEKYKGYDDRITKIYEDLDIGAESDKVLAERAYKIINKIIKSDCHKIMIVGHGGILLAMIRKLFHIIKGPEGDFSNGDNCWIAYMTYDDVDGYKLLSPPNTEHLSLTMEV